MDSCALTIADNAIRLHDGFGRGFRKLRLSITDACNLHCLYCGGPASACTNRMVLTSAEIISICEGLSCNGIDEIRLTGGEPTLHPDIKTIVSGLSELRLRKLGMTTNGLLLKPLLPFLKTTACRHLNISLDSLKPDRFLSITGSNRLNDVVDSVIEARKMGFHVKVNMVLLRGINDDEVFDYIGFSARHAVEVRFLELMHIGPMYASSPGLFISAAEMIDRIRLRTSLSPEVRAQDSTSFNFRTEAGARIGFIASESKSFCHNCSRLRLTSRGTLRACLMDDNEISLRGLGSDEYPGVLHDLLEQKSLCGMERTRQSMCSIGG